MATAKEKFDMTRLFDKVASQFRGLDQRDPSLWSALPRYILLLFVAALVLGALWWFWLKDVGLELDAERETEAKLRAEYQDKVQQAVSLEALKNQLEQVQQYVVLLEKQLPSSSEMAALLFDINQAGLGRSLQFEIFKPGQLVIRNYYAELPIALKVSGRYHDLGEFTADLANLSRIVTLNNIVISPPQGGPRSGTGALTMEATVKTYRYLAPEDMAAAQQAGGAK